MSDKQIGISLIVVVLMILLIPLRWLGAATVAALVHEMGHYIAVRCFGGTVHGLKFGITGAVMEANNLPLWSELVSLFAGPLAGMLLSLTFRWFPVVAICATVQSVYNLLPIYPLDGGKILKQIICMFGLPERCCHIVECITLLLLVMFCVYIRVELGISMYIFPLLALLQKYLAKRRKIRYNSTEIEYNEVYQ